MNCIQRKSFKTTFITRNVCHFSHCLSSGCKNKISQTRYLKQQTVFHSSRRMRGPRSGVGKAGSWLSSQLSGGCHLYVSSQVEKRALVSSSFYMDANPKHGIASKCNHLIKSPPPHIITLGIWASTCEFWETHSVHNSEGNIF